MFGNKNCIDKNIQKKLKLEEVQPTDDSTYKSYWVSYDGDIINNIDIPKDKFIKDIQLGYSNASLNDDGTINIGDGSNKDQICFSISSDTGYNLKLIQLPHGNVTSEDLNEKLKTKADLVDGKVPNNQLNIDAALNIKSNNLVANSTIANKFNEITTSLNGKIDKSKIVNNFSDKTDEVNSAGFIKDNVVPLFYLKELNNDTVKVLMDKISSLNETLEKNQILFCQFDKIYYENKNIYLDSSDYIFYATCSTYSFLTLTTLHNTDSGLKFRIYISNSDDYAGYSVTQTNDFPVNDFASGTLDANTLSDHIKSYDYEVSSIPELMHFNYIKDSNDNYYYIEDHWVFGLFICQSPFYLYDFNLNTKYKCSYKTDRNKNVTSLTVEPSEIIVFKDDISNLTAKLNTKMTVYNGGVYQEDSGSKLALVNELKNTVTFDEDGVGVCTINFNNSIFGGSKIDNANLVAKVYNVTADNLIEIKGTVTGKYTISGQPKGTVSGDTIGTDDISYIKHYDFDLKWNTSTNKEILYICKELNVQADLLDTLSYGVRWNSNKSSSPVCQRIGNLQMHRELPIQNGMKGCIVKYSADKKPEIQYYLDENDWRFRKDPIILKNVNLTSNEDESTEYLINDVFKTLQYKNQYIKVIIDDVKSIYKITDIDTETGKATIASESEISTQALPIGGSRDIELGSCLNGYDGEVMVEVPEFYIRSWEKENGDKEVRISQYKIDDTWEKQPHCLISPYCVTLLREVPENMGYLSTLPASTAISVCNTETYCRGGNNDTAYDKYLKTDSFRTSLGKPATNITRATMRANCRKSKDKEIMSYNQYKRILYWLYVIEYANFNCQLTYNSKLDSNGFKQGGLGNGVTTVNEPYWNYYNGYNPLTPNGYTNEFGNGTNIKAMTIVMPTTRGGDPASSTTQYVPRWHGIENPFGDIWNNVDGIIINSSSIVENGKNYSEVYATDDPTLYSDSDYKSMKRVGIELNERGYVKEWDLDNTAEIIPRLNGGNTTQYKCDCHWANVSTGLRTLLLGGGALDGGYAGLGYFFSRDGVGAAFASFGFRSSCVVA